MHLVFGWTWVQLRSGLDSLDVESKCRHSLLSMHGVFLVQSPLDFRKPADGICEFIRCHSSFPLEVELVCTSPGTSDFPPSALLAAHPVFGSDRGPENWFAIQIHSAEPFGPTMSSLQLIKATRHVALGFPFVSHCEKGCSFLTLNQILCNIQYAYAYACRMDGCMDGM